MRRRQLLLMMEENYVATFKNISNGSLEDLPPPICPKEPAMPGLYHFHQFEESVTLPWNWKCYGGQNFVQNWEKVVHTDDFRDALMRLVYWWTRMKVSSMSIIVSVGGPGTLFLKTTVVRYIHF